MINKGNLVRVNTKGRYYFKSCRVADTKDGISLQGIERKFFAKELTKVLEYAIIGIEIDETLINGDEFITWTNWTAMGGLIKYQYAGGKIIALTSRSGSSLDNAIEAIGAYGLVFDGINKFDFDLLISANAWPCKIIGLDFEKILSHLLTSQN